MGSLKKSEMRNTALAYEASKSYLQNKTSSPEPGWRVGQGRVCGWSSRSYRGTNLETQGFAVWA